MDPVTLAILASAVIGGGASIFGASQQTQAAQRATAAQMQMFQTAMNQQKPFIQAGKAALPSLTSLLTPGPNQTAVLSQLPGFQFAQDWGQRAIANQGTVSGLGGNVLAAGSQYATGLAQQGWGDLVSRLQGLASMGSTAAANTGQQAVQTGQLVGSNLIGIGNAQAGAATATGANVGNALTTAMLLQRLNRDPNAPTSAWPAGPTNAPDYPNPYGGSWYG